METFLNAASTTAGALISSTRFTVPAYQREYSWNEEEVGEFFDDLRGGLGDDNYFLGLIILTGTGPRKEVVDGQQRLLTLTLLASSLYHQAMAHDRRALAERLQSTFLYSIDFDSDKEEPRMRLTGAMDDSTLNLILDGNEAALDERVDAGPISSALMTAYRTLAEQLSNDLQPDPFKRLGMWADFLTNKLYMAVFVHPDLASAYKVFEVVNTRGKELTTADLLKNYVLSQTADPDRLYLEWQDLAGSFPREQRNLFVQFIRHAVTTIKGHVLPRDLYDVLAGRGPSSRDPIGPESLIHLLQEHLPPYQQMLDPTTAGPATDDQVGIFSIFNRVNVIVVRPLLLAMLSTENATAGMEKLLRLVVRRVAMGSLGTGNVERRLGQAAARIRREGAWEQALAELEDLNPAREDFETRVQRRSMNRNVLAVLRESVLQSSITPDPMGYLYFIRPRNADWSGTPSDRVTYWVSTIGNSFIANLARRPTGTSDWEGFKTHLLPAGAAGELMEELRSFDTWGVEEIEEMGRRLAERASHVWY